MTRILDPKALVVLSLVAAGCLGGSSAFADPRQDCMDCHKQTTPGVFDQWSQSKHSQHSIGCYECHQADRSDPDAFEHNGALISIIVSPKDCARCHMAEVQEFTSSRHAMAADRMTAPLGRLFAEYVLGNQNDHSAAANGCWQCHGTQVIVNENEPNKLDPLTWPNAGIGPINPDGSRGRCSACHSAHEFSAAKARQPEGCELCHGGSTASRVAEIYRSSLHGITYSADPSSPAAPTCAGCHMSGTKATHNVGERISSVPDPKTPGDIENRNRMVAVCSSCHLTGFTNAFFARYKKESVLVEDKWKGPAKELYCQAIPALKEIEGAGYVANTHPIDFTYMGYTSRILQAERAASMMSQRYVDDTNMDLAQIWFRELVPQLRAIIRGAEPGPAHGTGQGSVDDLKALLAKILAEPAYGPGWPAADFEDCGNGTPKP
jgi:hypothetical protein